MTRRKIYIAGPMRGHVQYNFPAFDDAAEALYNVGWQPVNPADLDRDMGYEPEGFPEDFDWTQVPSGFPLKQIVQKDLAALVECDAIFLLEGWEFSRGARAELAVALWLGIEVIFQGEGTEFNDEPETEDILEEAMRLTSGDRQAQYGPPTQDFSRTAAMWTALFGHQFEPKDVALAMILLKASRQVHQKKRDNWVDIAGYARCGSICDEVA
jgi:hypothetical protein